MLRARSIARVGCRSKTLAVQSHRQWHLTSPSDLTSKQDGQKCPSHENDSERGRDSSILPPRRGTNKPAQGNALGIESVLLSKP